jgi:hypothetical protein
MATRINDDFMSVDIDGAVIATATRAGDGWTVTNWLRRFTRNQAITALTLAERLAAGYGDDDPFVSAWQEELRRG